MSNLAHEDIGSRGWEIEATRVIDAAAGDVFDAWIDADHLAHWWGPRDGRENFTTPHVEVEPWPGGVFRTCIRSPKGQDYWARGVFREVDAPRRLVFTHGWEDEHGEVESERRVAVEFAGIERTGKTRVALHITGYQSPQSRNSETGGWNECLDRLVEYFVAE